MATDAHRVRAALPDRPIEAEIDPFVIDQVVSNLVDNALRYTKGAVRVSLDAYRSSVTIAVTDEGPGIDPAQLNLVLEPLYRIDENVQSGTGLGLHIVRTLVEAHGGRGEIRSGATGTSIAVKLPRTTGGRLSVKVPPSAGMRRTG
jgi:two-component system sensor histidine kinase KdpD